jgi:hypothetical protein
MASEVCARFDIGEEARKLLRADLTPSQYLELLGEQQHVPAAIRFLAHALPKREAVWWACACAREAAGPNPPAPAAAALKAAENWVANPTDENRRAAMPAAQAAGIASLSGTVAMAAFVSGGSLAPPNVPPVPPAENLTSELVGGAVLLAALGGDREKVFERFRACLGKGMEIGSGAQRWPEKR